MRWTLALLCLGLSAAPALAQTSNCMWLGSVWTCNSTPPLQSGAPQNNPFDSLDSPANVGDAFNRGYEQSRNAAEIQQRQRQEQLFQSQELARRQQEAARADLSMSVKQAVGELLQQGKCQEAIDTALKHGEVETASQAKSFCSTPSTSTP